MNDPRTEAVEIAQQALCERFLDDNEDSIAEPEDFDVDAERVVQALIAAGWRSPTEVEKMSLALIEARNPGIDIDEVRRIGRYRSQP